MLQKQPEQNNIFMKELTPTESQKSELGLNFFGASVASVEHPERNEDAIFLDQKGGIAIVLDGVGGLSGGGRASQVAKDFLVEKLTAISETDSKVIRYRIRQALIEASNEVLKEVHGGGTTATVAKFFEGNGEIRVIIGHVGDSRCYILRGGKLKQVTEDDDSLNTLSLSKQEKRQISARLDEIAKDQDLEQASPEARFLFNQRNVITQMLGDEQSLNPHIYQLVLQAWDRVILTSDGVHDNLTKGEIEKVLKREDHAVALVQRARTRSIQAHIRAKPDDISAIVVEVG